MNAAFVIAAAVAVASTFMVITRRQPIHALLYLIVSLLAVAVVFFLLGAPFIAALEVIVYAGAIMVLFVFVMMMLNLGRETVEQERRWLSPSMWIGPSILAVLLLAEFVFAASRSGYSPLPESGVRLQAVGFSLFTEYAIGVEIASMLLLAGLVGAFHLARRQDGGKE